MNEESFDKNLDVSEINNQRLKRKAYFFVIIAAVLWNALGVFGKKLNQFGFKPRQVVFIRAVGASITLIMFASVKNIKLLKIKPRNSVHFVGTGIISFVFL